MHRLAFLALAIVAAATVVFLWPAEAASLFTGAPPSLQIAMASVPFAVPSFRGIAHVSAGLDDDDHVSRAERRQAASANKILAELRDTFEAFKDGGEKRIAAIENELAAQASRSAGLMLGGGDIGAGRRDPAASKAEREGLGQFVRSGDMSALAGLNPQAKLSTNSDPDGGYTVMPTMADTIRAKVLEVSPLGRLARYQPITTGDAFEEPYDDEEADAEWVSEEESRPERGTPKLRLFRCELQEIYTNQPVTQRLLDDSSYNIGAWLEGKIGVKFARKEGSAFVNGDGVKKPRGILQYPTSASVDAGRPAGTLQYVATGAAAAFPSSNPGDALLNLVYSLRAPYRPNARWLMNLATAGHVRKFKDGQGNYLWAESMAAGQPPTLLGFPVELDEEMPNLAANAFPIAFGDFNQGYTVIDRPGMKMLRDPYTAKPNVMFYAYRRVGGGVHNSEAIKLLKCAVS